MWFNDEIKGLTSPQLVNDSKTPSGQVHVGSLRGVVLHDVINRALREHGVESRFTYALDDMDPLDGLPADASDQLKASLGKPLSHVAPPPGSSHQNLAEHYAADFLATFTDLGVEAELYRMSDSYKRGVFNEAIAAILGHAELVREVYFKVSKSRRPDSWYPYQVVCEQCGNIGSTEVYHFDGREVQYRCIPSYTSWANGCGYGGSVSPFDGKGKLVWKLEWVAKWHTLGVTFEGAGKDHCTKGGSRDVANACMRRIFGKEPPRNLPYEFFLVGGSKMSSSKGVGASAASMAGLLPPAVLRFLMINTPPKRTVNFSTEQAFFVKLFNEYDRVCAANHADGSDANQQQAQQLARLMGVSGASVLQPVGFQLLLALLQLPHLDLLKEIQSRYQLDQAQLADLDLRIATARNWLDHFAEPADRVVINESRPDSLDALPASQCQLLHLLADAMEELGVSTDDAMQQLLFDCARLAPCAPREAFVAVYRAFLDSDNGPKAGSLLAYLDKGFVLKRLRSCKVDRARLWEETGLGQEVLAAEIRKHTPAEVELDIASEEGNAVVEAGITLADGRVLLRRSLPMPEPEARQALGRLHEQIGSDKTTGHEL